LRKKHGLGVLSRKPFLKILADYGIQFEELDRDTAKEVLDSVSVKAGVRTADMIRGLP
jgi:hypothetical protein